MGFDFGIGSFVESGAEKLLVAVGVDPEKAELLGDLAGIAADLSCGNYLGAAMSAPDLVEDLQVRDHRDLPTDKLTSRYPAENDVEGWRAYLEQNGYDAVKTAIKEGKVGKEVMADPSFGLALQDAKQQDEAYWALMTGMSKSDHDVKMQILRNTFA